MFASSMESHTFRVTATEVVKEYIHKHEQGARLQPRWAQACCKNPNPISHQEKAQNLQAAIHRVLRGGWAEGSRFTPDHVSEAVPHVEHGVMRGPEAREGGSGLGRGAAAQGVGIGRGGTQSGPTAASKSIEAVLLRGETPSDAGGRGERSLGTQRR